jgi:hypothetical protein
MHSENSILIVRTIAKSDGIRMHALPRGYRSYRYVGILGQESSVLIE